MSPQISVSQKTYAELEKLAKPFIDKTPEDVIIRLIRATGGGEDIAVATNLPRDYASEAPHLGHTKIVTAKIDGDFLESANWNRLLDSMVIKVARKIQNPQRLRNLVIVNSVVGPKEDQGYRYLPSAELSVQGQDSNGVWKAVAHLARTAGIPVEVEFRWLENPKAAHPGESGRLSAG